MKKTANIVWCTSTKYPFSKYPKWRYRNIKCFMSQSELSVVVIVLQQIFDDIYWYLTCEKHIWFMFKTQSILIYPQHIFLEIQSWALMQNRRRKDESQMKYLFNISVSNEIEDETEILLYFFYISHISPQNARVSSQNCQKLWT